MAATTKTTTAADAFDFKAFSPESFKDGYEKFAEGLTAIAAVVSIAPMLGFLGTVSGMINAFEAIAASDQVSAKLVASGISEALITTASGLVIAIPTSLFHAYFTAQVDKYVVEMEETSSELINELTELGL